MLRIVFGTFFERFEPKSEIFSEIKAHLEKIADASTASDLRLCIHDYEIHTYSNTYCLLRDYSYKYILWD